MHLSIFSRFFPPFTLWFAGIAEFNIGEDFFLLATATPFKSSYTRIVYLFCSQERVSSCTILRNSQNVVTYIVLSG